MSNMFNPQSKILNRLFRKVEGVVWDLSSNSVGLQNSNGITTLTQTEVTTGGVGSTARVETQFGVSVNPFDAFGFPIPAFAQLTKLADINVGDLVIGDSKALGWVIKVRDRSLELMDQTGLTKNYTPPKVAVLNQDGALVVKSLSGLFGEQGALGFSGAIMPLMLMGDSGLGNLDDILPLMLLTQQSAGANNANALSQALPTILMMKSMKGGSGSMKDMLLPMMMMGGLNGGGGMNPMMLMALMGEGGLSGGQFIADGIPALNGRPVAQAQAGVPPLQTIRR